MFMGRNSGHLLPPWKEMSTELSGSFSLSSLYSKKGRAAGDLLSSADLVGSPSILAASLAPEGMGSHEIFDRCTYPLLLA